MRWGLALLRPNTRIVTVVEVAHRLDIVVAMIILRHDLAVVIALVAVDGNAVSSVLHKQPVPP